MYGRVPKRVSVTAPRPTALKITQATQPTHGTWPTALVMSHSAPVPSAAATAGLSEYSFSAVASRAPTICPSAIQLNMIAAAKITAPTNATGIRHSVSVTTTSSTGTATSVSRPSPPDAPGAVVMAAAARLVCSGQKTTTSSASRPMNSAVRKV